MSDSDNPYDEMPCPYCKKVFPLKSMRTHLNKSKEKCKVNLTIEQLESINSAIDEARKEKKRQGNKKYKSENSQSKD